MPLAAFTFQAKANTKEQLMEQLIDHAITEHKLVTSPHDLMAQDTEPSPLFLQSEDRTARLSFTELTKPVLCEKCGKEMLESDYDCSSMA